MKEYAGRFMLEFKTFQPFGKHPLLVEEITYYKQTEGIFCRLHLGGFRDSLEIVCGDVSMVSEGDVIGDFENFIGISMKSLEKAFSRLNDLHLRCKRCGSEDLGEIEGFPGETLTVCNSCGKIVGLEVAENPLDYI